MTDLERKLAETLREQAGEVTPNLDAAWAEQQRRQQRRPRRRRAAVWGAPLAAVLVVLTSVLLATQVNTGQAPPPAAHPGEPLVLPKPEYLTLSALQVTDTPAVITTFAGQSNTWSTYVFTATVAGAPRFCLAAVPRGDQLIPDAPQYGTKSPLCMPIADRGDLLAGYVGEDGGPLPAGKAVYVVDPRRRADLRLFDAAGNLSQPQSDANVGDYLAYLTDVNPGSPPVRFEVS
ncbi:hypothetical protein AMES_9143 [Amycolatopsis mediterranei S699]|uniref:Uncharacterized protein n=2 Tax=Amycolatopsis mediterranei TaxID=33910 RepID=A0A0H3DJD0_AMYMU|nr:hypothetical protein [Amycolatopsis mediterranei]ADJ50970.1 hypothetical protein AMED_9282 [Amycolatopsis mediterranei U32]AEK47985.1 hypothetical protein RAM_47600 [Amycolatopsis mediterranei S699]AFO82675.1 hypothetical protein AMES_9143 [Amycolatopsis mediterranei S699]AGT89804.1 hypothetical protein B737_9144 [Amycolatopsis mediterranei RB]KDO12036.1 hypothetical protein DV26_03035 [Amycolatopsis mediterranei]